jgi:hypothetical protein
MLESDYKRDIRKALEKVGAKVIPIVTGPLTERGTPDIIGAINGMCFVIEAKVYPNTTTLIQDERLKEWQAAGAYVLVPTYPYNTVEEVAQNVVEASRKRSTVPQTT